VVGVSTDAPETAERFGRELDLPFPLVGDPGGAIARAYRARWPLVGWARRVTYVIGPDRRIREAFHSETAVLEHAARASEALSRPEPA
jgi:peroxiredoxin Q/BCP